MTTVFTQLKALWDATTKGSVSLKKYNDHASAPFQLLDEKGLIVADRLYPGDAEFHAFAHNAVPEMLAEVERLQQIEKDVVFDPRVRQLCADKCRLLKENTELKARLEKAEREITRLEGIAYTLEGGEWKSLTATSAINAERCFGTLGVCRSLVMVRMPPNKRSTTVRGVAMKNNLFEASDFRINYIRDGVTPSKVFEAYAAQAALLHQWEHSLEGAAIAIGLLEKFKERWLAEVIKDAPELLFPNDDDSWSINKGLSLDYPWRLRGRLVCIDEFKK